MNNLKELPYNITKHNFISGIYFNSILKKIINIIIENKFTKILDFGCGFGYLKKKLIKKGNNIVVINYDIIQELSEVKTYKILQFDFLVLLDCSFLLQLQFYVIVNLDLKVLHFPYRLHNY